MLRMRLAASTEKQQPWICFDFVWAHQHGIADHLTKLESKVHLSVCPGDKDLRTFFLLMFVDPFFLTILGKNFFLIKSKTHHSIRERFDLAIQIISILNTD